MKELTEEEIKEKKLEGRINLWIMIIGSFIIGLNHILASVVGIWETPAFIFVVTIYAFMLLFIHLIYNPIGRFRYWLKNRK